MGITRDAGLQLVEDIETVELGLPKFFTPTYAGIFFQINGGGDFHLHRVEVGCEIFLKSRYFGGGFGKDPDGLEVDDLSSGDSGFVGPGGQKLRVGLAGFFTGGEPVAKARF